MNPKCSVCGKDIPDYTPYWTKGELSADGKPIIWCSDCAGDKKRKDIDDVTSANKECIRNQKTEWH